MDWFSGWCRSSRRLDNQTAIITGCNTGIGKETAMDLFMRGATVIMACRDFQKTETAKKDIERMCTKSPNNGTLLIEKLDLSNSHSIREFVKSILDRDIKIQILVNNAGVMLYPESRTQDGFEVHMGTNHLGHALLTLLLLPRLRESAPARIIFVSSYLHAYYLLDLEDMNFESKPYDPYEAYCRSKAANVLFARALANELMNHNISGITTYSLHPGVIRTEISRHFSTTFWPGATWFFNNIMGLFLKSPRCGAQTSLYCAIDDACGGQTGLYYSECAVKASSKETQSDENASRLWANTLKVWQLEKCDLF